MIIRPEQMKALNEAAGRRFENEMTGHLFRLFPSLSGRIGETGLRAVIRHGTRRARDYGILRERDVGRYIAVMMMFGIDFDKRKNLGPMYSVLRDSRLRNSHTKAEALSRCAVEALKERTLRAGRKPSW